MWTYLRIVATAVGLCFMGWLAYGLYFDSQVLLQRVSLQGVLLAVFLGMLSNGFVGIVYYHLIKTLAPSVTFGEQISSFYNAQIAKYIPGRLAALIVQRSFVRVNNATTITLTANIELAMLGIGLNVAVALSILAYRTSPWLAALMALGSVLAAGHFARINWLAVVSKLVPKLCGLQSSGKAQLTWRHSYFLTGGIFLLPAASSFVLLHFGMGLSADTAFFMTSISLLSWAGGLLALVFPVGVGVREVLFMWLASHSQQNVDMSVLREIALASRFVQLLTDALGVTIFFSLKPLWFPRAESRTKS